MVRASQMKQGGAGPGRSSPATDMAKAKATSNEFPGSLKQRRS